MDTPEVTPPEGMIQLLQTGALQINKESKLFKYTFYILGSDNSFMFTTKGLCDFKLRNKHMNVVAEFIDKTRLFAETTMNVTVCGIAGPPLTLRFKDRYSKSLFLDVGRKIILKIKKIAVLFKSSYFEIWTAHPITGAKITKIGDIKSKDDSVHVTFPPDLEIRCKTALIAACILLVNKDEF